MSVIHVSHNFTCDRDIRELGEDHPELKRVEWAYRIYERALERAARKVHSARATASVMLLGEGLADSRHDASFGSTLSLAEDAYGEAMVRPVEVKARAA